MPAFLDGFGDGWQGDGWVLMAELAAFRSRPQPLSPFCLVAENKQPHALNREGLAVEELSPARQAKCLRQRGFVELLEPGHLGLRWPFEVVQIRVASGLGADDAVRRGLHVDGYAAMPDR